MAFNNFPYADMQDLNIDWLLRKMKETDERSLEAVATANSAKEAAETLTNFVNNYFDNLDVQEEINNKINEMAGSGELAELMRPVVRELIPNEVSSWLSENVTPTTPPVDASLSISGAAADAKVTGDRLEEVEDAFTEQENVLALSAFTQGQYIDNTGAIVANTSMSFASVAITSDMVGKALLVDGSAWYSIKPFVFVGEDSSVVAASVPGAGSTHTQYTKLTFVPSQAGTLYVNRYSSGSVVEIGRVYTITLASIKLDYLPPDTGDAIKDAISYTPVEIGTLINSKLLNGNTGAIEEGSSTTQRVSDFIEVDGDTFYLLTTDMYYGKGMYVWYDENRTYISGVRAAAGTAHTQMLCERIKSPSNARYLVIGFVYTNPMPFPFLMKGYMNGISPSGKWKGKKWEVIGDSISVSNGVTGAHYHDLIRAATGIQVSNRAESGCGYAIGINTFRVQAARVQADADVVTMFGSGNDARAGLPLGQASDTGVETIAGCINAAIDALAAINPVMQIGIITPTPWQNNMPSDNGFMQSYSELIVEICKLRSIPCLDLFHCSNLNPNSQAVRDAAYSRDDGGGVHPNETGHALIAPRIQNFLDSLLIH